MLSLIFGVGSAARRSRCSLAGREGEGRMRMPIIGAGIGVRRTLVIRGISRYLSNGTATAADSDPGVRKCCCSIPVLGFSAVEFAASVGIRGPRRRFPGTYPNFLNRRGEAGQKAFGSMGAWSDPGDQEIQRSE